MNKHTSGRSQEKIQTDTHSFQFQVGDEKYFGYTYTLGLTLHHIKNDS